MQWAGCMSVKKRNFCQHFRKKKKRTKTAPPGELRASALSTLLTAPRRSASYNNSKRNPKKPCCQLDISKQRGLTFPGIYQGWV